MGKKSNSQIRKLGDNIRKNIDNTPENLFKELEEYRVSYKGSISRMFELLYESAKKIRHDSITTYRIKRIESILSKLNRYPKMDLDRMWDIAGCRCVFSSEKNVYKLLNTLEDKVVIRKKNDYYTNPQETGYKSIHIYISEIDRQSRPIELQIRTRNDHNWATLVEIIDLLYGKHIKEGQKDKDFERFHKLMSYSKSLKKDEKSELINLVHKHQIFNRLYSVFAQNYLNVRMQWLNLNKGKHDHFYIIEVKDNSQPIISAYSSFNKAEKDYFEKFIASKGSNIVLTYLPQTNFQNIEIAYANYTLTTHTFIDDYFRLISDVCVNLIEDLSIRNFYKSYCHFISSFQENRKNIINEISTINSFGVKNPEKIKYWRRDIRKRVDRRMIQIKNMMKKIEQAKPKKGLNLMIFKFYAWRIDRKQESIK